MRAATKKLTTAAVCTALSVIMCAATAYLPLSFMPLYLAAFCIFLACKRAGLPYGLLCAAASIGLMFAMTGLSVTWFLFVLIFAPYGVIAHFISRFSYFKLKSALLRLAVVIVYFALTFGLVFLIVTRVSGVGLDIPVTDFAHSVGGFAVLEVIVTAILVPLDFIFYVVSVTVLKRIPMFTDAKKRPPSADDKTDDVFSDFPDDGKDGTDGNDGDNLQ